MNRAETLPIALASVCGQTVSEIEILVVLDGATQRCRRVATAAAAADPRIRVLDLPKAPGAGAANVDAAISTARAGRIFYIDDDDVWTPNHIASLGPHLDQADVVDCPTVSLGFMGGLHLAPMTTGNRRMRSLLADWRYKCVFDVHIAHRREVCTDGRWWSGIEQSKTGPDAVWTFLGALARDDNIRWRSSPRPTSLSIHGACRRQVDTLERSFELSRWALKAASDQTWSCALQSADCCNHVARLLTADPPCEEEPEASFSDYFRVRGFDVERRPEQSQRRLCGLHSLACGRMVPLDLVADIVDSITRPVIYAQNFREAYALVECAFGPGRSVDVLRSVVAAPVTNLAGCWGALAVAYARIDDRAQAISAIRRARHFGPDPNGLLAAFQVEITGNP